MAKGAGLLVIELLAQAEARDASSVWSHSMPDIDKIAALSPLALVVEHYN